MSRNKLPSSLDLDRIEAESTGQERAKRIADLVDRLITIYGVVVLTKEQYLAWLIFGGEDADRNNMTDNIWVLRRKEPCQS